MRWVARLLIAGCFAAGCGEADAPDAAAGLDASTDASPDTSLDASPDASAVDAGAHTDAAMAGGAMRMRVRLHDGTELEGELVATYEHARWWIDPSEQATWALFDPNALAPWPDDRSMRFISSRDVDRSWRTPLAPGVTRFRDAMRDHGVVFDRVPIEGVTYVATGNEAHHLEENGYGDFAWDLIRLDERGMRHSGDGTRNEDYYIFGAEVRLPTRGYVVEVIRDAPDRAPGPVTDLTAPNNLVGVQIFGRYYLYFLHFQHGSIPNDVVPGAFLDAGALLGRVGNSGVTIEPHLHMTAMGLDESVTPPRAWSVPAEMAGAWVASPGGDARRALHHIPQTGESLSNEPF